MSKQQPKDMLTRLDEQIEFFTARRHFSYVGFFEECKKEIEQLRHDLSRAVEREAEHLAEARMSENWEQKAAEAALMAEELLAHRSASIDRLLKRIEELEAENAELRAELFCNQMCVRYWPSHHVECRLLANRLKRIKLQADDEGEAER